jgi:hypothetical protein
MRTRAYVAIAGDVPLQISVRRRKISDMKTLLAVLLCMLLTVPAFAGPPQAGNYKSTDLGGSVLTGTYSETWNGGPMAVNNTVNEKSWDGTNLGTQWLWTCAYVASAPTLLYDGVNASGDGNKIWYVTYTGGTAQLLSTGPWGDEDYDANVLTWEATVTETYQNFVEVGTVKTVNATAQFIGYDDNCIVLALSNLEKHGDGMELPPPGALAYPEFIDNTCSPTGEGPGEWGEVDDITYSILQCTVGTEEQSWGSVKALYR